MIDLVPALIPLVSRCRQDITWRRVGKNTRCDKKTPVSKSVLKRHFRGIESRGVCPILEGENTTRVVTLDLDSHKGETDWQSMTFVASNVYKHFTDIGFNPVPFRSSGGNGIHIFFIWDNPQDAYSIRKFFIARLKECGFRDGTKGVSRGEIEIFPKQDFVPKGGFGNQFILPLSAQSRPLEPMFDWEVMEQKYALNIDWIASPDVPFIEKPKGEAPVKKQHYDTLSPELKKMLDAIPNEETNYDLWIKIGMALKTETGGSEEGLALWEEWSARCPEYSGSEELQYKWNSFRDDKDKIVTLGSIKKLAAEHGWREDYSNDFENIPEEAVPAGAPLQKTNRFKLYRADEYAKRPAPKWLIKHILPEKSTGMTFGGSGDGKTFAVLDMACAVARGIPWRGKKTRKGHVVYICAEGAGSFSTRLGAYCTTHGIKLEDLGDFLTIIPAAPNFMQKKDVEELVIEINGYNKQTDLIIVDTLAQTTTGAEENSAKDMNIALKYLEALRSRTNSAAHLVHHAGKNEERGARGSSSLKGALDVQFQVSRDGEKRLFWVAKMKDGIDGYGWNFTLDTKPTNMMDEDDIEINSCVVNFDDTVIEERPTIKKTKRTDMENLLLQAFESMNGATVTADDLIIVARGMLPDVDNQERYTGALQKAFASLVASHDLTMREGQVVYDLTEVA